MPSKKTVDAHLILFIYRLLIGTSLKIYLNIHRNKKSNVLLP